MRWRTVLISPVEGWVVVRGNLISGHLRRTRVVHSEMDGRYDLALELADHLQVLDRTYVQTALPRSPVVLLHLLIYRIADGTMAISFAHFKDAGCEQLRYSGAVRLAVEKEPNKWETIEPRQLTPHEVRGPHAYTN